MIQNFAEAFEEIPLTIARNSGMDVVDTIVQLRNKNSEHNNGRIHSWYGVDAIERKVSEMYSQDVVEPLVVKEQVIKTASEVASLLIRVDEVIMKKPTMYTHTHGDGKSHSHARGNKPHDHFDSLVKCNDHLIIIIESQDYANLKYLILHLFTLARSAE